MTSPTANGKGAVPAPRPGAAAAPRGRAGAARARPRGSASLRPGSARTGPGKGTERPGAESRTGARRASAPLPELPVRPSPATSGAKPRGCCLGAFPSGPSLPHISPHEVLGRRKSRQSRLLTGQPIPYQSTKAEPGKAASPEWCILPVHPDHGSTGEFSFTAQHANPLSYSRKGEVGADKNKLTLNTWEYKKSSFPIEKQ